MTTVVVDTSVWRRYFSGRIGARDGETLAQLLDQDDLILCHPAVLGELVLGGLARREELLLARLPACRELSSAELLDFIHARKLARKGIGWVDCQLLASSLVIGGVLWSLDRPLARAAASIGIAFERSESL